MGNAAKLGAGTHEPGPEREVHLGSVLPNEEETRTRFLNKQLMFGFYIDNL
jgi:hypothetical protein